MTGDSRIRRPALARTAPRRNLASLFVPPPVGPPAAANGAANDSWTGVVSRSVELGYRVIDDYVRHGEHAARTFGGARFATDPLAPPRDAADLALRMTQSFSEFATLWMGWVGMMQTAMPGSAPWGTPAPAPWAPWPTSAPPSARGNGNGSAPSAPYGAPSSNGSASAAPRHDAARLDVDLVTLTPCRARVTVELWPEAAGRRLALDLLHGAGEPRRIAVAIHSTSAATTPTLHIRVPAEQPPGTYTGDVLDEDTAVPVGRVVLRVDPP